MKRAAAVALLVGTAACATHATLPISANMPAPRVIQNAMGVFRQHNIPMLEISTDGVRESYLLSGPFDPRDVWSPGEVNERVRCGSIAAPASDSATALVLDVRVYARPGGAGPADERVLMPRTATTQLARSQVTLRASGELERGGERHACVLAQAYSLELIEQITGQPIARSIVADSPR